MMLVRQLSNRPRLAAGPRMPGGMVADPLSGMHLSNNLRRLDQAVRCGQGFTVNGPYCENPKIIRQQIRGNCTESALTGHAKPVQRFLCLLLDGVLGQDASLLTTIPEQRPVRSPLLHDGLDEPALLASWARAM